MIVVLFIETLLYIQDLYLKGGYITKATKREEGKT